MRRDFPLFVCYEQTGLVLRVYTLEDGHNCKRRVIVLGVGWGKSSSDSAYREIEVMRGVDI